MKKHVLYYYSPCIIAAAIDLLFIIPVCFSLLLSMCLFNDLLGGIWKFVIGPLVLWFFILIGASILIKRIIKRQALFVWISEALIVGELIYWLHGN